MTIESATYIDELNDDNPGSTDPKSEGDNHLRLIKTVLQSSFPNISGAVAASDVELSYVDGVTSAIQTQLNDRLSKTGGTMSGAITFASGQTITGYLPLAGGTMTGDIAVGNNDITGLKTATFNGIVSATTTTIDWAAGFKQSKTLSGSVTLTFTSPGAPTSGLVLRVVQGSSTLYNITWPSSVKWPGGNTPTVTQIANKADIYTFYFDGTNYYGSYAQNYTV